MDDTRLLDLAAELAARAGAAILDIRARGFLTRHKTDNSPVTEADHAAEAVIVAGLRAATPFAVIAEEEIEAGHVHQVGDSFWLVDPLDGTKEFAAGRDEFTVNIGLVRNGVPVLGAVGVPAFGEVFTGGTGLGAWKQDGAGRHPISARPMPPDGLHVLASRSLRVDNNPRLDALLGGKPVARVSLYGSALKFCRLAEGVADLYPRFGRTMEWDTAAPQAVLEGAGGTVRALDGAPMRYGKPGWDNPGFVCTGRV